MNEALSDLMETCEAAARAGGKQLLDWRGRFQTRQKGLRDLVTDADYASQAAIESLLNDRFPDIRFIGEEQTAGASSAVADELAWVVDPLDGTTNYVHGYTNFAVSVAAVRGSQLLAGAIFDPVRGESYTASKGGGSFCNRVPLEVSRITALADALVAVSLPADVTRNSPDLLDFVEVVQVCQAVRRSGSAALNLAHVANGSLDAFWAAHIHPWDVAAGILLIREAGGVVSGRNGNEFELWNPHFVAAANPSLHQELLGTLRRFA